MKNEKILIFGDSYSTFEGYVPEGFDIYYPNADSGVDDVSKTWWHMLASETGSEIMHNNSWSGSTVCNTGYNGDCSTTSSFIARLNKLTDEKFFDKNTIDRVFIFGGTNDCWTGNKLGTPKFEDWSEDDLKLVLPGYSYFVSKVVGIFGKEKVHIIINNELKPETENGFITIAKECGVGYTHIKDVDKLDGHPTVKGMEQIKNQVLANLK